MKRTILFFMLALCAVALVPAQGNNRWGQGFSVRQRQMLWGQRYGLQRNVRTVPEETSVSGNLTIVQGMIAVVNNDTTYFVRGLNRFVGFIDGLKEGAAVSLTGSARTDPRNNAIKFLQVQKMTLNGKEYDIAQPRRNVKSNQKYNQQLRPRGRGMMGR